MEASTSPSTASTENLKREGSKNTTPGLETITLGVWTVTLLKGAARDLRKSKDRLFSSIPDIRRLFLEVLRVDPWAFAVLLLSRFFHGIEASLLLHLSARLLQQTERMLVTGKTDMPAILSALTMRLACVVFVQLFGWWR
ncbi:hypothetical protein BD626DRAFT_274874 [Schizophyllum amplum]|uniref:Uncharacterized protein n=1 Tax=Schizophyllum amplum TaxID=97359 RepID=A0A550CFT3_9AGAR|nr:hypothetical protein BD626DRAFT_274874 [Auriculariopsis ampla]